MKVKFNKNAIKKLNKKAKINKSGILAGVLTLLLLTGCNKTLLDTKYGFDEALILGDDSAVVLDVKQWKDYSGEQLQVNLKDNTGFLSSFVNVTIVESQTEGIEEIIASAFSGDLKKEKELVKVYK